MISPKKVTGIKADESGHSRPAGCFPSNFTHRQFARSADSLGAPPSIARARLALGYCASAFFRLKPALLAGVSEEIGIGFRNSIPQFRLGAPTQTSEF